MYSIVIFCKEIRSGCGSASFASAFPRRARENFSVTRRGKGIIQDHWVILCPCFYTKGFVLAFIPQTEMKPHLLATDFFVFE